MSMHTHESDRPVPSGTSALKHRVAKRDWAVTGEPFDPAKVSRTLSVESAAAHRQHILAELTLEGPATTLSDLIGR